MAKQRPKVRTETQADVLRRLLRDVADLRQAVARLEDKLADSNSGPQSFEPTPLSSAIDLSLSSGSAAAVALGPPIIEPAVPIKWVWQRLAMALGMNSSTMYYSKPLKNVNKAALTKRLNDLFDDNGITIYTTDLAAATTVGDVYDVITGKL